MTGRLAVSWIAALAGASILLIPIGAWIQWDLPGDCPCELIYLLFGTGPALGLALGLAWGAREGSFFLRWLICGAISIFVLPPLWGDAYIGMSTFLAPDPAAPRFALFAVAVITIGLIVTAGFIAVGLIVVRRLWSPSSRWLVGPLAGALIVLSAALQVLLFVPEVSRTIGPWARLRDLLRQEERRVIEATQARGIPSRSPLDLATFESIRRDLARPSFTFPLVRRTVHVRMMTTEPPYVGVDYGGGRNCIFDLHTMRVIYAD